MTSSARQFLDAVVTDLRGAQRPGQQQMVDLVEEALRKHSTVLIQAGTGTGKSVGYLVPAVMHAAESPQGESRAAIAPAR